MKKNRISNMDKLIFASLYKAKRPLPMKKIATRTNVSWPTVRNSVTKLKGMGVLNTQSTTRRTNVSLNDAFLRKFLEIKRKRKSL
jgi:predicted transcriptional regulator